MFIIGAHLSLENGYEGLGKKALDIGANTFQFFTRNPKSGKANPLDLEDVKRLNQYIEEGKIHHVLAHAPYTMNPSSDKPWTRNFAEELMIDDLNRLNNIPGSLYNFHPGSHVGQGPEKAIEYTAAMLNRVLKPDQKTIVLLETMAGKGSEIGRSFDEIAAIIEKVECKEKIGVCWDTCHLYDAGYDFANNLEGIINEFDEKIGLDKLHAIHLNDSKNHFKSHRDRHEKIGQGTLGLDTIQQIINHPKLRHLPFYLETPHKNDEGFAEEIRLLKSIRKEQSYE